MKSSKIRVLNTNPHAGDSDFVRVRDFNKVIEDLEFLYPVYNIPFRGTISLDKALRQYDAYTVNVALDVKLDTNITTNASASIQFIADGATTPTFTAFTQASPSETYDITLAAINLVKFWYDGKIFWYQIILVG